MQSSCRGLRQSKGSYFDLLSSVFRAEFAQNLHEICLELKRHMKESRSPRTERIYTLHSRVPTSMANRGLCGPGEPRRSEVAQSRFEYTTAQSRPRLFAW